MSMSARIKKDRRERRRGDRVDGGERAAEAERLSARLSDLIRSGNGGAAAADVDGRDVYGLPGRVAPPLPEPHAPGCRRGPRRACRRVSSPPSRAEWGALAPDVDGSLPSDGDHAFARGAAVYAERAWAAAEWLGRYAVSVDAGDCIAVSDAQAAARNARFNAIAAQAAADAAVWPADVMVASGLPPASASKFYDAARAGWQAVVAAAAAALPADVRIAIEARLPVPARPARAAGLLQRAHAWAADIAAAATRPAVDVLDLARAEAWAAAPPRVGGWGDDDQAEFDELDNGVDLQAMAEKYIEGIEDDRLLGARAEGGYSMPGHGLSYRWCGRAKNLLGCRGPDVYGNERRGRGMCRRRRCILPPEVPTQAAGQNPHARSRRCDAGRRIAGYASSRTC